MPIGTQASQQSLAQHAAAGFKRAALTVLLGVLVIAGTGASYQAISAATVY